MTIKEIRMEFTGVAGEVPGGAEYINWLESEYAHATVEIERLNRELVEARIMNAEQRMAQ